MGFSSENFSITAPAVTNTAWVDVLYADVSVPAATLNAPPSWGSATVSLPAPTLGSGRDFGWNAELTIAAAELAADGAGGLVFAAEISTPAFKVTAEGTFSGTALLSVPAAIVAAEAYQEIDWGAISVSVPPPDVVAFGAAVLAAIFQAWCMNVRTTGVSEYTNFAFNSMARFNGKYYASASDGVYLLEGDDDNGAPITAEILSGITDYGSDKVPDLGLLRKRSGGAYLNLRSQGQFQVVVRVDEGTERSYSIDASGDPEGMHTRRVQLGRRLEGRNWQFGFKNASGVDFTLRDFHNVPIYLSRRI